MKRFLGRVGYPILIGIFALIFLLSRTFPGYRFSGYLALVGIGLIGFVYFLRWLQRKKPRRAGCCGLF